MGNWVAAMPVAVQVASAGMEFFMCTRFSIVAGMAPFRPSTKVKCNGGEANGFLGLYGNMGTTDSGALMFNGTDVATLGGLGDTATIYGTVRSTTQKGINAGAVDATGNATGGATVSLALSHLDSAITISNKRGAKRNRRIFLMSEERVDEVAQLLQSQQRFISTGNTVEFDGGFRVLAYRRIPIVGSRFMDSTGVTKNTTVSVTGNDNSIFLLDLDKMFMAYVAGVNAVHVPVVGGNSTSPENRADIEGGYYKSYGVFVMKRFDTSVLIFNLSTP